MPDVAKAYVTTPASGKRFDSDYNASDVDKLVKSKKDRAEGGRTIVCVSDRWTLEYDLALYGCAKLMHMAISLAVKAKSRDERLEEADEVATLTAAEKSWTKLLGAGHTPDALAAIIYRPLKVKEASKAIAAQYAAHLVTTGDYGKGEDLFKSLPPYLQAALSHLTTAPPPKPVAAPGASGGTAPVHGEAVAVHPSTGSAMAQAPNSNVPQPSFSTAILSPTTSQDGGSTTSKKSVQVADATDQAVLPSALANGAQEGSK